MDPFVLGEGEDGEPAMEEAAHLVGLPETALPDTSLPGEDEVPGSDDHLWMYDDGRIWDLGPADVDSDADGIPDSLTRTGPDGMTVYTDRDHDGRVDTVTRIGADGSYDAHRLDADTGNWVPTDSGRLD